MAVRQARDEYLALCLLEAIADENWSNVQILLQTKQASGFCYVPARQIAAAHYAAGMPSTSFGIRCIELMLQQQQRAPPSTTTALSEPTRMSSRPGNHCIDVQTDDGETPLQIASYHGHTAIAWLLLCHGASPTRTDVDGNSAIVHAMRQGHEDLTNLFREHCIEKKRRRNANNTGANNTFIKPATTAAEPAAAASPQPPPPSKSISNTQQHLAVPETINSIACSPNRTPQRRPYNLDRNSPYFINITHRDRGRMQRLKSSFSNESASPPTPTASPSLRSRQQRSAAAAAAAEVRVNLFDTRLTRERLQELAVATSTPFDIVERWRSKVQSIEYSIENEAGLLPDDMDDFDERLANDLSVAHGADAVAQLLAEEAAAAAAEPDSPESSTIDEDDDDDIASDHNVFLPVPGANDESNFIRSPSPSRRHAAARATPEGVAAVDALPPPERQVYQVMEKLQHTDLKRGLALYELKIKPDIHADEPAGFSDAAADAHHGGADDTMPTSVASTRVTVPLDYDTDALRAELTQFGVAPGPISMTTKRLYMKRLLKLKRDPVRAAQLANNTKVKPFSLELQRTLRTPQLLDKCLQQYAGHIERMVESFKVPLTARRKLREGGLKKSFVYLLIDPRVSENLSGEVASGVHTQFDTWERFLRSIFYVGKGKNGRPYDHLYDALELFNALSPPSANATFRVDAKSAAVIPRKPPTNATTPSSTSSSQRPRKPPAMTSKIQRIHDIWSSGKGVVCRPLFHNIIPTDAFTREAAIIDALGLPHLTNAKAGEYYGAVRSWPMRERKQLGAALLHRALLVLLADGESQLRPDDLL